MKIKDSIILIVVFVVAIFLGIFIGVKVTDNKSDTDKPNQAENNGNKTTELSTAEAEKIMSKYKFGACRDYIDELSEINKLRVTVENTASTETRNCSDKDLGSAANYDSKLNYCYINHLSVAYDSDIKLNLYKYSELLNTKRSLFGSNETLENKDLEMSMGVVNYISSLDSYIFGNVGTCNDVKSNNSTIVSAKIVDSILKIRVISTSLNSDEVSTKGEYEYIFKKANSDYYLTEITEIK